MTEIIGSSQRQRSLHQEKAGSKQRAADGVVEIGLQDLISLNRLTGRLSLKNMKIRSILSGSYISRVKGRGMEFDEVRLYTPGDDVRSLDWRVTARTGKAHTKLYREERERPIFLSVDYRSAMFFATRGVYKSVLAAKLAALIAWSGDHHADRVGGQIFCGSLNWDFKPRRGKQGILPLLKHLADLSSELRSHKDSPLASGNDLDRSDHADESLAYALERLYHHCRPGSLVFMLSDFRGLNHETESLLLRLSRHCDMVPILIYDPLERQLPDRGTYRISDGRRKLNLDCSDRAFRSGYADRFQERLRRLEQFAVRYRIKSLNCCTTDQPLDILLRLTTQPGANMVTNHGSDEPASA